jgi:choline trimethylamine-lyase
MVQVPTRKETLLDRVLTIKPTARVERLRERMLGYRATAQIFKSRINTRVMKETEGEPQITRIAKAFAAVVRESPLNIYPDELFVGFPAGVPRAEHANPDVMGDLEGELDTLHSRAQDAVFINDVDKEILRQEIIPYWRSQGKYERTQQGRTYQLFPPEVANLLFAEPGKFPTSGAGIIDVDILRLGDPNHATVDFEKVIQKGFLGIKKEVEERLARIDYTNPDDVKKVPFIRGMILALEAASEIGKRFALKAREMAAKEADHQRKAELLKIAEVCDRVPARPARTFYEAMQSIWFTHIMTGWEFCKIVGAMSPGRMDQLLFPYYQADIKAGKLTKEAAQELVDCWFLKFPSSILLNNSGVSQWVAGFGVAQHINVGGLTADGSDATNDLSYMFIEAMMHNRLPQPTFGVRIHSRTPDDFLIKACQLVSLGTGHPSFFNDDVIVPALLARNIGSGPPITIDLARTCSIIGCVEPQIAGKEGGYTNGGYVNLAAPMEMVMTNGFSRMQCRKIGVETGDPGKFKSFDEVKEAYHRQLAYLVKNLAIAETICEIAMIEVSPSVFNSALLDDCIEKGIPREAGGARYNFGPSQLGVGIADAADSLTAIKKLVFEDKKITLSQLCEALAKNFEGYDEIRHMLLKAPKYGNDDNYADEQVAWISDIYASEVKKYKNARGGYNIPSIIPVSTNVPFGKALGALPSGRLSQAPLADGCSPGHGNDIKGPTTVLKSVAKIDHAQFSNGTQLNMRVDPAVFKDAQGFQRLANLIRGFVDNRIWHVQINVVSSDTLRAAQKEPEKYRDLVVKVAGYNTFFVLLHKDVQNDIISRTEHSF